MNKIYKVKKMPQVTRWRVLNLPKVMCVKRFWAVY